jgi:DNA helicase IV
VDPAFEGSVVVRRYRAQEEIKAGCEACLAEIASLTPAGGRASVLLLGRYRYLRPEALAGWTGSFASLDIEFKTVHAAKGLQADYVIVLGLQSGRYAFPSEIADDPLLQLVLPSAESFSNAEERRLFYVALTRARHRVYLLSSVYAPSSFVKELMQDDCLKDAVLIAGEMNEARPARDWSQASGSDGWRQARQGSVCIPA